MKRETTFLYIKKNPPPNLVLNYRKRLEKSDVMFLIGSCHNLRLNSILENWIDWVLHPNWFFAYKSMFPSSKFFRNYGYPVPGAMKGKQGIVSITYGGPMISYLTFLFLIIFHIEESKKVS